MPATLPQYQRTVRLCATTNLTVGSGAAAYQNPIVDGELVQPGVYLLLTAQTNGTNDTNGIYYVWPFALGKVPANTSYSGGTVTISSLKVGAGLIITNWGNATSLVIGGNTYTPANTAINTTIVITATSATVNGPDGTACTFQVNSWSAFWTPPGLLGFNPNDGTQSGTQITVTAGLANSGTWIQTGSTTKDGGGNTIAGSPPPTFARASGPINLSGTSYSVSGTITNTAYTALQLSITQLSQKTIGSASSVSVLQAGGPAAYPGFVIVEVGSPQPSNQLWQWNASSIAASDGITVIDAPAFGYTGTTPGRWLWIATL